MQETIKVHVVRYKNRPNLVLRYLDPATRRQVAKSAGTVDLKEANKLAIIWEAELRENRYVKPSRMTWEAFVDYYSAHVLPGLAANTIATYEATFNVFKRLCRPAKLADVTTARVTAFVTELRKENKAEATIARHLRHLKAAMRWANREGMLPTLPAFTMPKRVRGAKLMRGRPITGEEFERMIEAVPAVVENAAAESWEFYLRGLWASGLRLTESLTLRWDDAPGAIVVDLAGRRPMLQIPAEAQKANRDELLPMTPEFVELLESVPASQRRGRVFKLVNVDGKPFKGETWPVSRMVSAIGEKAGVVVDEREKGGEIVRKFASAHDLRRAFGQRWAGRVLPTVLRRLMRHSSIETTMKYYVSNDADATADALWSAAGSVLGSVERPAQSSK
jgi:integrase